MFTLKLLLKRSCWTFIFMALALPVSARVCFLPDSTDCGEGDVVVPEVQITCATYGGYETEAACLEARTNKTAQTCTLNSGCYYPKCAYDSERKCKNENPDKKCLSQDVDGVKCWYSQPKTCSEQGYQKTPCATDEDSGTVPNTLEASDGPCYKCTPKKECKYISNLYYGPNDTCPQYTDRKDAGVTGKDGVCSTCEPQACSAINTAYKNAANQNTCGSDKEAKKVAGTDSAADGPCYTCEDKPTCKYKHVKVTTSDTHASQTFDPNSSSCKDLNNKIQSHIIESVSYYDTGKKNYHLYNKISKDSKSCYDKKGTPYYETICSGWAKVNCKEKFVPNGCSSEKYNVAGLNVESMEFGDCVRVCDVSEGLYDTEDECKKADPKYPECKSVDNCYVQIKKGWGIHYSHKVEKKDTRTYSCTRKKHENGIPDRLTNVWVVSVYKVGDKSDFWRLAEDLDGKTHGNIDENKGEARYPAGRYKICFNYSYSGGDGYISPSYIRLAKTDGDVCEYRYDFNGQEWHADKNNKKFCSNASQHTGSTCMTATFEEYEEYSVEGYFKGDAGEYSCNQVGYSPY